MIGGRADEKEIEVIAEKSRIVAYVFLALALFGAVVATAGIILYFAAGYKTVNVGIQAAVISLTALGAVMIAVFTALFIKQLYRSYALITLENGVLKFQGGATCSPNQITAFERDNDKIILTINGEKKEINGVANCDKAYRKLCVLTGNPISE